MPRNTAAEPRYRRPSQRRLARTLRTLKSMLPPPANGHGSEDLADFMERLVDKCQQMSDCLVQHGGGDGQVALPPSPPLSPLEADADVDNYDDDEAQRLESYSCFSKAAIDDLVEQMLAMEEEEEAEPHLL